jgi:hypothetical protein
MRRAPRSSKMGVDEVTRRKKTRARSEQQLLLVFSNMFRRTSRAPGASCPYSGLWVALDNCRFDSSTKKPVEGDVVDSDSELAVLTTRLRQAGRSACTILFCGEETTIEAAS